MALTDKEIQNIWASINAPTSQTFDPKKYNQKFFQLEEFQKNVRIELDEILTRLKDGVKSKDVSRDNIVVQQEVLSERAPQNTSQLSIQENDHGPRIARLEIEIKIYSEQCQKLLMEVQRYHILENNITILSNKVSSVTDLEQRINIMIREFDIDKLQKLIAQKADRVTTDKNFSDVDLNLTHLQKDLDHLITFYKKLIEFLESQDQEQPIPPVQQEANYASSQFSAKNHLYTVRYP